MSFFKKFNIGNDIKYCSEKKLDYIYYFILGSDLHTKIRLKPLLDFFSKQRKELKKVDILEIGCGFGINAIEISKIIKNFNYEGFDLNEGAIEQGRILLKKRLGQKAKLFCADATRFIFPKGKKYDFILLIDFIEHIDDPIGIITQLKSLSHEGTMFLVSVPTRNYRKYFGESFHRMIGHVHDGYSLHELDSLFYSIGFKNMFYQYSTGVPVRSLCSLYYKFNFGNRYLNLFKNSILGRLSFFDFLNSEKLSCSLFSVYRLNLREHDE